MDMETDRLEAWAEIAGQTVHPTEGRWQNEQQSIGATAELGNAGGKGPSPGKAPASQASDAKHVVGTKRRVPSVFE